ncbi:MAG: dihydroneopterin aldolase [Ignavibacteriales bacterium]|nr:dihydroneopterin aldolase [Ignavibacteriales bacterium]
MKNKSLDVIRLYNAVFYAYHGVLSDEQNLGGKFEVDVELHCDLRKGAKTDHLRDTVDYEQVYDCIRSSVLGKKYFLLEALGQAIVTGIFSRFPKVRTVTVRLRKPGAAVRGVIDTVEVEMTRSRK